MKKFGWNKFWNFLTIIPLKRRWNSAETSFKIVLQCFRWSAEWIRLRQVLRLAQIFFIELMRKFGWNTFWNCLTMISLMWCRNPAKTCFEFVLECFRWSDEELRLKQVWNFLRIFSLKWWRMPAKTCFENVLELFRWSDEDFRLERVLNLSENIFVEVMKKSS